MVRGIYQLSRAQDVKYSTRMIDKICTHSIAISHMQKKFAKTVHHVYGPVPWGSNIPEVF